MYAIAGARINLVERGNFTVRADSRLMWFLRASETAHLSDFDPNLVDSSPRLGSKSLR